MIEMVYIELEDSKQTNIADYSSSAAYGKYLTRRQKWYSHNLQSTADR